MRRRWLELGRLTFALCAITGCDQVFGLERGEDHGPQPYGHWRFDEPSGTVAADDSATPHPAALVGSPVRGAGIIGGALIGDGVDDHVRIDGLDFRATSAVTVSLWIRFDRATTSATLFESSDNYAQIQTGFGMFVDLGSCPPGRLAGELNGDAGYTQHCYAAPTTGTWRHLVTIYDKTRPGIEAISFYLDGVLQPNQPSTPEREATNTGSFGLHPLFLLSRVSTGVSLAAAIDDLQIFDRALTVEEVLAIQDQGSAARSGSAAPAAPGSPGVRSRGM